MTHTHFHLPLLAAALLLAACADGDRAPRLATLQDTLSWAMGENIGLSLQQLSPAMQFDNEMVQQAIRHTLAGKAQPLSDSAFREVSDYIVFTQQTEQMKRDNQTESMVNRMQEAYFAQLVQEHPDVKQHASGFYYEELKAGKGRRARYGDRISFDYRSYMMFSGEAYDQTYGKREPILHVVGKPMFQGLVEGMQLMNAGSIYRFYFPYQLAFGSQGTGDIPGFTPFIYEIEMHEILDN